jgi:thiamine kinase-like enzyme
MPKHHKLNKYQRSWITKMVAKLNKFRLSKTKPTVDVEPHRAKICEAFEAWKEVDQAKMEFMELPGEKNEHTLVVTSTGAEPEKIILRLRQVPAEENEHYHSENEATKLVAEAGFAPKRLDAGEDLEWCLEEYAGVEPAKEKNHKDYAELLANVHKTPTEWFDKYREKVAESHECLQGANAGNPIWWFAVHPAFLSVLDAEEIAGLVADAVEPLSEFGKKVVTCHGDFHKDNVLEVSGALKCIDLQFACSGWAALDIALHFDYTPYSREQQQEFVQAYLKSSGQEEENAEETQKLLYDVEMASTRAGFMNCYLHTCEGKKEFADYQGEVWAAVKAYEVKAREDPELQKNVVKNGVWLAVSLAGDEAYKKSWDKWGKIYGGAGSKGCCKCAIF